MDQYLPIFTMLVLGILFCGMSFFASGLLAPKKGSTAKEAPYECGIVPDREPAERFPVRFYVVAMLFIIFDIEIIFLYPWAVSFGALGTFGLVAPTDDEGVSEVRTSTSTIRRVPKASAGPHAPERGAAA